MTTDEIRKTGLSLLLGAGASADLGFPSGEKLKRDILEALDQPRPSDLGNLIVARFSEGIIERFRAALRASLTESVDAFLYENREDSDFVALGRLAVWVAILSYERRAAPCDVRRSWFYVLLNRLYGDCERLEDLYRHDGDGEVFMHGLQIHTLNYDRVAEEVLWTWIGDKFPNERLDHPWLWSNIEGGGIVRHHHGRLGPTRRNPCPTDSSAQEISVRFGAELGEVSSKTANLKFWFEPANTPHAYSITNRLIELRSVHMILGFGFHRDVSGRFEPPTRSDAELQKVIATCRDHSPNGATIGRAQEWLQRCYGRLNLHLLPHDAGCLEAVEALLAGEKTPPS